MTHYKISKVGKIKNRIKFKLGIYNTIFFFFLQKHIVPADLYIFIHICFLQVLGNISYITGLDDTAKSNLIEAAWKVWQFPLPHIARVFWKRH